MTDGAMFLALLLQGTREWSADKAAKGEGVTDAEAALFTANYSAALRALMLLGIDFINVDSNA